MTRPPPPPRPRRDWAYFLDLDGTLARIAPTPEAAALDEGMGATLARLVAATGGAVALISGRPLAEVDRLLAPLSLAAAGLHGLERRGASGRTARARAAPAALARLRPALAKFARAHPGCLLEDKGPALALHFRGAPASEAAAEALVDGLLARDGRGLVLQRGKKVLEIRAAGDDKGAAIRRFMAEPPFRGRVPVFAGDDATDEDGFAAVNAMGGVSVRVGASPTTCARFAVASVAALRRWLGRVVAGDGESRGAAAGRA
ncbi:MAG TPA: trehalose-phosphatase [Alphaproteobacteria bacterium]